MYAEPYRRSTRGFAAACMLLTATIIALLAVFYTAGKSTSMTSLENIYLVQIDLSNIGKDAIEKIKIKRSAEAEPIPFGISDIGDAVDKGKDKADEVVDKGKEVVDKGKDKAEEVVDKGKDAINGFVDDAYEKMLDAFGLDGFYNVFYLNTCSGEFEGKDDSKDKAGTPVIKKCGDDDKNAKEFSDSSAPGKVNIGAMFRKKIESGIDKLPSQIADAVKGVLDGGLKALNDIEQGFDRAIALFKVVLAGSHILLGTAALIFVLSIFYIISPGRVIALVQTIFSTILFMFALIWLATIAFISVVAKKAINGTLSGLNISASISARTMALIGSVFVLCTLQIVLWGIIFKKERANRKAMTSRW